MFRIYDPAYEIFDSVHGEFNARYVRLRRLGALIYVQLFWIDDGPANGRERHPDLVDAFTFPANPLSWRGVKLRMFHRLERAKDQLVFRQQ